MFHEDEKKTEDSGDCNIPAIPDGNFISRANESFIRRETEIPTQITGVTALEGLEQDYVYKRVLDKLYLL